MMNLCIARSLFRFFLRVNEYKIVLCIISLWIFMTFACCFCKSCFCHLANVLCKGNFVEVCSYVVTIHLVRKFINSHFITYFNAFSFILNVLFSLKWILSSFKKKVLNLVKNPSCYKQKFFEKHPCFLKKHLYEYMYYYHTNKHNHENHMLQIECISSNVFWSTEL